MLASKKNGGAWWKSKVDLEKSNIYFD